MGRDMNPNYIVKACTDVVGLFLVKYSSTPCKVVNSQINDSVRSLY